MAGLALVDAIFGLRATFALAVERAGVLLATFAVFRESRADFVLLNFDAVAIFFADGAARARRWAERKPSTLSGGSFTR